MRLLRTILSNPFAFFGFLTATSSLVFGIFVLAQSSNRKIGRAWFVFTLSVAGWGLGEVWIANAHTPAMALFDWRWTYAAAIIWIPVLFYRFVRVFCGQSGSSVLIQSLIAVVFSALTPTDLFFSGVRFAFSSLYYGFPGPAYVACVTWWCGLIVYSHWVLWRNYRAAPESKKNQLKYFFLATAVGYTGGLLGFIPKLNIADIYPWGYLTTSLYPVIMSYAILKFNLMDIRIFIRRAALLAGLYIGLVLVAGSVLLSFHLMKGKTWAGGNWEETALVSLILSAGPFLYAYFVRRSAYFHESTLAGITHEMKSPLAAIDSALELLRSHNESLSDRKQIPDYIDMIERNTTRLRQFVDTFLTTSGHRTSGNPLIASVVVQSVVQQAVAAYESAALKKGLALSINMPTEPIIAEIDTKKIEQALSNIVSNAIKFSDEGKITVTVKTTEVDVSISVKDEACGIPASELPQVFDRFFQGKSRRGGTGLGLAISQLWVEAHGGRIWAESEGEGKGTTVTFTLPAFHK